MLKLCANLKWLFTEVPLLDRFRAAARAGFEAVEYPTPYEQPVATLRTRLNDHGLSSTFRNFRFVPSMWRSRRYPRRR